MLSFWLDAVARGKNAHGSMPELGENAIYKAARAMLKLETFDFRMAPHPYLGASSLNIGTIDGGMAINSVPDRTVFSLDIRTIPDLDHGMLLKRLHRELGDEVSLERRVDVAGIRTDPSHPWIQSIVESLTPIPGERPEVRTVP